MARDFTAANGDVITGTLGTAVGGATDCTFGCWFKAASVTTNRALIRVENGGAVRMAIRTTSTDVDSLTIGSSYDGATNFPGGTTDDNVWVPATWTCAIATWTSSTKTGAVYVGTVAAAMTGPYNKPGSPVTTGTTADAAGTSYYIGNNSASSLDWDDVIERPFSVPWIMTVPEMDRYRLGYVGVLYAHGTPRLFLPLNSPTAATAFDMSGVAAVGTVTGATAAEGPPVPLRWCA
jgi:hypothetical protein